MQPMTYKFRNYDITNSEKYLEYYISKSFLDLEI